MKKYQHIELCGWWCSGVDPLNNYVLMMWGCFKPDHPRRDRQKVSRSQTFPPRAIANRPMQGTHVLLQRFQ
ncbi:hypothetical protein PQG02_35805 (plasmid) [Nostoc sp. UHCC 0926]|uniref:hypothetical protein n=1 Tax=Nostoc sp. UHCC 0926 TaxID=3025190 RepID=UPI00236249D4|nr:hypothetical protein [Nostoc sp. UHCC 0926]WDD36515.1 hypothetical protein PQG02_35805 [Nostoc sp. UHCC 0926]